MSKRPVDRAWFVEHMARAGYSSQAAFAEAADLTSPKLSNILSGKRRVQSSELYTISATLRVNIRSVIEALGENPPNQQYYSQPILAAVVDGAMVKALPPGKHSGFDQCFVPYEEYEGRHAEVRSDRFGPRYKLGDILAGDFPPLEKDAWDTTTGAQIESLIGQEVFAAVSARGCYLGTLFAGDSPDRWTVVLADPDAPPFTSVELAWATAVDAIIPAPVAQQRSMRSVRKADR